MKCPEEEQLIGRLGLWWHKKVLKNWSQIDSPEELSKLLREDSLHVSSEDVILKVFTLTPIDLLRFK